MTQILLPLSIVTDSTSVMHIPSRKMYKPLSSSLEEAYLTILSRKKPQTLVFCFIESLVVHFDGLAK